MTEAKKLSYEDFVCKRAIPALRKDYTKIVKGKEVVVKALGIHTVMSGFNNAFKAYYGKTADPIVATKELEKAGKIVIRPAKKGVMLFLAEDAPNIPFSTGDAALEKMGL